MSDAESSQGLRAGINIVSADPGGNIEKPLIRWEDAEFSAYTPLWRLKGLTINMPLSRTEHFLSMFELNIGFRYIK